MTFTLAFERKEEKPISAVIDPRLEMFNSAITRFRDLLQRLTPQEPSVSLQSLEKEITYFNNMVIYYWNCAKQAPIREKIAELMDKFNAMVVSLENIKHIRTTEMKAQFDAILIAAKKCESNKTKIKRFLLPKIYKVGEIAGLGMDCLAGAAMVGGLVFLGSPAMMIGLSIVIIIGVETLFGSIGRSTMASCWSFTKHLGNLIHKRFFSTEVKLMIGKFFLGAVLMVGARWGYENSITGISQFFAAKSKQPPMPTLTDATRSMMYSSTVIVDKILREKAVDEGTDFQMPSEIVGLIASYEIFKEEEKENPVEAIEYAESKEESSPPSDKIMRNF